MTISSRDAAVYLGTIIGEACIVKKYFEDHGYLVELSDDPYDQEKDMIVTKPSGEEFTVEVKTQYRWKVNGVDCMTVGARQIGKCTKVDRLLFVEYNDHAIHIWQCNNRNNYIPYRTSNGISKVGYPIASMKRLKTITDSDLVKSCHFLSSQYPNSKGNEYERIFESVARSSGVADTEVE